MMRISVIFFGIFLLLQIPVGCKNDNQRIIKPFLNENGKYIGDSLFINGVFGKIIFNDTSLIVDSIVYKRFDNKNIKSINTYVNGKKTFENIEYYKSGKIKSYLFVDDNTESYFYKRNYNSKGEFISEEGTLFFQGYLTEINIKTLEIKTGKDMSIKIFFPNPPDCNSFLYVKINDNSKNDVFYQNHYINFLKTVSVNIKKKSQRKIWTLIDVWLELQGYKDTAYYNKPIYYKVVN